MFNANDPRRCPKCQTPMELKSYQVSQRLDDKVDRDGACGAVQLLQCPTCKNVEWERWS